MVIVKKSVETRLENLERELEKIKARYVRALSYRDNDPETALMHARKAAEAICHNIFLHEVGQNPGTLRLDQLIDKLLHDSILPKHIALPLRTIQGYGNFAAHDQGDDSITSNNIQPCLQALAIVVDWYLHEYQHVAIKGASVCRSSDHEMSQSKSDSASSSGTESGIDFSQNNPCTVGAFAVSLGMTSAAVMRVAREHLKLELRTPSAILQTDQIFALRDHIKATLDTARPEAPAVKKLDLGNGVTLDMVLIPAGTFKMGSPIQEEGHNDDELEHIVNISRPLYLGRTLLTQAQYREVVGSNPSYFEGPELPVEMVSWFDAVSFCEMLVEKYGKRFRLPTEAEWEYACRAGAQTPFFTGNTITLSQANFDAKLASGAIQTASARWRTTPVRSFPPNAWGLYDMCGNVWEWCGDWYGEYPRKDTIDPIGPETGDIRVLRGGSWFHGPADARSAQREALDAGRRHSIYGFRVALEV